MNPAYPELYRILTVDGLHLPHGLQAAWWRALRTSTDRDSHAVFNLFRLYDSSAGLSYDGWMSVLYRQLGPTRLIQSVERLAEDHLLSRAEASRIQEQILSMTTRDGSWKPVRT